MTGYLTIEYNDQVVDVRYFNGIHRKNQVIEIWKKRYAHLYYAANIYITLQSKMNKINYDY